MKEIVEREQSPKPLPKRYRATVTSKDLFTPSKPAIPTAGKQTALERAKAMVERLGDKANAYEIAIRTYMTKDRDPVSGLPRPTARFEAYVEQVQSLIDNQSA